MTENTDRKPFKIIILSICGVALFGMGLLVGLLVGKLKVRPVPVITTDKSWSISEDGELSDMIEDNFWRFARASYVLIGDYPDYQFYKIVKEVPRHDFDLENFYIDDDSDKMYYHDDKGNRKSSIVIDVSTFQQEIDWKEVKAAGIDMAIIRVGYRGYGTGAIVEDEMFENHCEGAIKAGLKVGVYFFSQALNKEEGIEEAEFVLDTIKKYKVEGPIVIDTEDLFVDDETRTDNLSIEDRTDSVVGFCETVKKAGHEPMIYANRNWFVQCLDMSKFGDYKLWLALYANNLAFPYRIAGWQYSSEGYVPGVEGNVDLSVWFED